MGERRSIYLDDSYSALVWVEDGEPVEYASLAAPPGPAGEAELAARIFELTGRRVSFGEWVEDPPGDPRDRGWTVHLRRCDA